MPLPHVHDLLLVSYDGERVRLFLCFSGVIKFQFYGLSTGQEFLSVSCWRWDRWLGGDFVYHICRWRGERHAAPN